MEAVAALLSKNFLNLLGVMDVCLRSFFGVRILALVGVGSFGSWGEFVGISGEDGISIESNEGDRDMMAIQSY